MPGRPKLIPVRPDSALKHKEEIHSGAAGVKMVVKGPIFTDMVGRESIKERKDDAQDR